MLRFGGHTRRSVLRMSPGESAREGRVYERRQRARDPLTRSAVGEFAQHSPAAP